MILEINKLMDSDFDMLKKLGRLLYHREDQNGGLSGNELHDLLVIINEDTMAKEYQYAYDEGFNDWCC